MHCPTPPIPPPEGYPFSKSPGDVDQPPVYDVDVYVGFWLDGVEQYRDMRDVDPNEAEILIYYNPVLQHFPEPQRIRAFKPYAPHNHDTIEIVVSCFCEMLLETVTSNVWWPNFVIPWIFPYCLCLILAHMQSAYFVYVLILKINPLFVANHLKNNLNKPEYDRKISVWK